MQISWEALIAAGEISLQVNCWMMRVGFVDVDFAFVMVISHMHWFVSFI